jgi:molybdenum cofactor biosynthesis protein B
MEAHHRWYAGFSMGAVEDHRAYAPNTLAFAVLTASDSRDETDDRSGGVIAELLQAAGYRLIARQVLPDEIETIRSATEALVENSEVDVIVLTGGTGLAPRDISVEAVSPLLKRKIEGFGELFRTLSYQEIGAAAMLSRACAGVSGRTAVFVIPGSPKAAKLAMESLILPEIGHLLGQLRRSD